MNPIADIVAGAVLLVLGRKLFWLFVAIAGFYLSFEVARGLAAEQPGWLLWAIAIGAGLIGALLAMLMQRVGFALGGFYAGGYIALLAVERFAPGTIEVAAFLIGGLIGAVLAALLMDWAIIVLSCLVGAALVVPALALPPFASALVYGGLVAVGIFLQAQLMRGRDRSAERRPG
ncbi:MAG TPA: DUF4203 domain-containing protein [Burkholderiales bacterium]|nr:DUF4203 domain-containing protein [Burkholderiales bacterium]